MKSIAITLGLSALLSAGCTTSLPSLPLDVPQVSYTASRTFPVTDLHVEISDQRNDRTLDLYLADEVVKTAQNEIRDSLLNSGIISTESDGSARWELKVKLNRLEWNVPGYKEMVEKVGKASLFTGGLGGLIYGSTKIDVNGYANVEVTLFIDGDQKYHDELEGHYHEEIAKLKCDTPETKVRVAGLAMSDCITSLVEQLDLNFNQMPSQADQVAAANRG